MSEGKRWRKMLLSGMIFAFVTMILGEIPIGWVIYPETGNDLLDIIMSSGNLSILQMVSMDLKLLRILFLKQNIIVVQRLQKLEPRLLRLVEERFMFYA